MVGSAGDGTVKCSGFCAHGRRGRRHPHGNAAEDAPSEGADAVTPMGMQRMMRPWKARTPSPPWECSGGCAGGRYHGEKVYPPFLPLGIRGAEHATDDPTAQNRRSETEFLWKGKKTDSRAR